MLSSKAHICPWCGRIQKACKGKEDGISLFVVIIGGKKALKTVTKLPNEAPDWHSYG